MLDLPGITAALVRLLEAWFAERESWPDGIEPAVGPLPPDRLRGEAVGLYLISVEEEPRARNVPTRAEPAPAPPAPRRLVYLLTAHSDAEHDAGVLREQALFSAAQTALEAHPVLDGTQHVGGRPLLPANLRLALRPASPANPPRLWRAFGAPLRLAALWEIVAHREPSAPERGF